ncbi:hypothetical protein [Nocardia rhamnosiphila]|uniref:hypothetical protein n=1 Tax=Nocardia rhamnosiphila TaxID=426716 RepID=UPI000AA6C467|nr:hypothetical protein [Nocardia rhamnosiphila]
MKLIKAQVNRAVRSNHQSRIDRMGIHVQVMRALGDVQGVYAAKRAIQVDYSQQLATYGQIVAVARGVAF